MKGKDKKSITKEYLRKHPKMLTKTLARKLVKDFPKLYPNIENARSNIRYWRKNYGDRNRKTITTDEFQREEKHIKDWMQELKEQEQNPVEQVPTIRKRLFYDIETAFATGWFWRPGFKLTITAGQVITPARIICISYKWEDEEVVHTLTWDKGDDSKLIQDFAKLMHEADEVVAHNGDRFDLKWVRTRALLHKIPLSPYIKTIDTLKMAKYHYNFNSNRLDDIGQQLGLGEKIKVNIALWEDIIFRNSEEALAEMSRYCEQDVVLLQDVYSVLRPYAKPKMHYGALNGEASYSCPECGSEQVSFIRTRTTAAGSIKREMKCKSCLQSYETNNKKYMDYFEATHKHRWVK